MQPQCCPKQPTAGNNLQALIRAQPKSPLGLLNSPLGLFTQLRLTSVDSFNHTNLMNLPFIFRTISKKASKFLHQIHIRHIFNFRTISLRDSKSSCILYTLRSQDRADRTPLFCSSVTTAPLFSSLSLTCLGCQC